MTIAKDRRISDRKDIEKILKIGKREYNAYFSLFYLKTGKKTRVKVIVPVKVDKRATKRNLLRRRASEILRNNLANIKSGYDIVLLFKKEVLGIEFADLQKEILRTLKKARLL